MPSFAGGGSAARTTGPPARIAAARVKRSALSVFNQAKVVSVSGKDRGAILLAGKTGTAQVVSLSISDGRSGPWKYRDHGLFVFFAPFDNPRYAGAVVIEHGGGSGSARLCARR